MARAQRWLMKSEPGEYAFDDLLATGAAGDDWDGVRNHQAAGFLREMRAGDEALFYHSGKAREVVGTMQVTEPAYPDPTDASGRFVAVRVKALEAFATPVPLAAIKAAPACADFLLVRHPRLSVMPVPAAVWRWIVKQGARGDGGGAR